MKTSHLGLGITEKEWETNMRHATASPEKCCIPKKAQRKLLELFEHYREEFVEGRQG